MVRGFNQMGVFVSRSDVSKFVRDKKYKLGELKKLVFENKYAHAFLYGDQTFIILPRVVFIGLEQYTWFSVQRYRAFDLGELAVLLNGSKASSEEYLDDLNATVLAFYMLGADNMFIMKNTYHVDFAVAFDAPRYTYSVPSKALETIPYIPAFYSARIESHVSIPREEFIRLLPKIEEVFKQVKPSVLYAYFATAANDSFIYDEEGTVIVVLERKNRNGSFFHTGVFTISDSRVVFRHNMDYYSTAKYLHEKGKRDIIRLEKDEYLELLIGAIRDPTLIDSYLML